MDETVERRIDFYVEMYGSIKEKVADIWTEDEMEITDRIFEQLSKDYRSELICRLTRKNGISKANNHSGYGYNAQGSITSKQKKSLYSFGIKTIPENLTKYKASEILGELFDLSSHGNTQLLKERVETLNEDWNGG